MSASPHALPAHVPLAVATRGGVVESVHYGSIAVVDDHGRRIGQVGDPGATTFTRSACKPFQAMPLIAHPAVQRFRFTSPEIALLCSSHSGEPRQVETVSAILAKIGCETNDLQCGVHTPYCYEALGRLPKPGEVFTPLHHNCSGKHAGMLALCKLLGAPSDAYLATQHPVQQAILDAVSYFSDTPVSEIGRGTDGCSAPNFAVPLAGLALAYARLATGEQDPHYGEAPATLFAVVVKHPEMVSGRGRFDLALTGAGRGDWVSKTGAEGVECLAIKSRGWGIAIKIADGAARALQVVVAEVLRQLELMKHPRNTSLRAFAEGKLTDCRGLATGEVRPIFELR